MKNIQSLITSMRTSIEHRASSIEHRASSIEHRASSIEHRAPSIEHRAPSIVRSFVALLIVLFVLPVHPQAQDTYPIPVSESVEKTGPGTMVFLSYPKYYSDAEEKLALVETDLVESTDPEWDYEVSKGIWQLKVKTDGTFQAQHEGDVFTYRFKNLGIGQGREFRSVDLGEPDFSNLQVIGDTIRWSEVLPDIDLTVRYIHDILKVDVIVKREFMNDLRAEVNSGGLNPEDFLTARFDIPSVFINSQAKQGGEDRDIYAEPIEFSNAPLIFERDGKVLHKLRPVESYVLDENGEAMYMDASNEPINIRSSQRWQLQRGGGGFAEMSANLGDIANAPEGDVVIDPSLSFGSKWGDSIQDSMISKLYPNVNFSTSTHWYWDFNGSTEDRRLMFGFDIGRVPELRHTIINSAELSFYVDSVVSGSSMAQAFKVTRNWDESTTTWYKANSSTNWSTSGGDLINPGFYSPSVDVPSTQGWSHYDVTQIVRSQLYSGSSNLESKGIIVKRHSGSGSCLVRSSKSVDEDYRPKLVITYISTSFGADAGSGIGSIANWTPADRLAELTNDNLKVIRLFSPGGQSVVDVAEAARLEGVKIIICYGAGEPSGSSWVFPTKEDYAENVTDELELLSSNSNGIDYIANGTVIGIELGNEEEQIEFKWFDSVADPENPTPAEYETAGGLFAEYYLEVYDQVRANPTDNDWKNLELLSGGSLWLHTRLLDKLAGDQTAKRFVEGFIDKVVENNNYHRMPDTIAIHGYTIHDHPESENTPYSWGFFVQSLEVLLETCNTLKVMPTFAITEYGYSAVPESTDPGTGLTIESSGAPLNKGDNITQATYYLRSLLQHGTAGTSNGWKYCIYFQHPRNSLAIKHPLDSYPTTKYLLNDHGFHNPNSYPGSDRAIRDVAQILFGSTLLDFGHEYTKTWIPFSRKQVDQEDVDGEYEFWCGWLKDDYILAVWLSDGTANTYYEPTPREVQIVLNGDYMTYTPKSTKFSYSQSSTSLVSIEVDDESYTVQIPIRTGSASLPSFTTKTGLTLTQPVSGETLLTVPNVDENPTFVYFEK